MLVGFEPTRILSATGIGIFDRGRERHVPLLRAAARASKNVVQTDGGISYNVAAHNQDTCCETVIVMFGSSRALCIRTLKG